MKAAEPEKDPMSVGTTVLHVFTTCVATAFVSGFSAYWGYRLGSERSGPEWR